MQKKVQKIFLDFEIIAFELVALNTRLYWERILVIGCQYVKLYSFKITDTTKTEVLERIFFHSDKKNWQKYCRADSCSVSDRLTCSLPTSVLTGRFFGI